MYGDTKETMMTAWPRIAGNDPGLIDLSGEKLKISGRATDQETDSLITAPNNPVPVISRPAPTTFVRTSWGEEARIRQTVAGTGERLCVMDYRAPAGFSPPRHVHREDDETLILNKGRLVLWTPDGLSAAETGDVVYLPRAKPHTWYNVGGSPVELTLIVTPGRFEPFFPLLAEKGLTPDDANEIMRIMDSCGMDFVGPPLSTEEIKLLR